MKKAKRIISVMMVIVLMLALSMSAFATGTVSLYVNSVYQGSYISATIVLFMISLPKCLP